MREQTKGVRARMRTRHRWSAALVAALATMQLHCGPQGEKPYTPFADPSAAPPAIASASPAIVRIHFNGGLATGAFISNTGLLLTNNHVLGVTVCPIEGCWIELTYGFERGQPVPKPERVFVRPVAVDVGLDIALVQALDGSAATSAPLSSPHFLTLRSAQASELVGSHVTIMGHPRGDLKKWTDGTVYDATGDWMSMSDYILPGDSGSPILDDQGAFVGIVHRSDVDPGLLVGSGANTTSIGTPSALVLAAAHAPLPTNMYSVAASVSAPVAVSNDLIYLNAGVTKAQIGSTQQDVIDLLATACDAALLAGPQPSLEALDAALTPCTDALRWIDCRSDAPPSTWPQVCPSNPNAWQTRFDQLVARQQSFNGQPSLSVMTGGAARLSTNTANGVIAARGALSKYIAASAPVLDFNLAYYLARYGIANDAGTDVETFIRDYSLAPHYERSAYSVAVDATWLAVADPNFAGTTKSICDDLYGNAAVDVSDHLDIEALLYGYGWL